MGNRSSVGAIHVSFDNKTVVSGSTVTGKVYVAIIQDVVSCTSVGSRIIGKESTKVFWQAGKNQHGTAREERNFLDQLFCLHQNPSGNMYKGQYEYPFQFTIPHGAPASMSFQDADDSCSISYLMQVWQVRCGGISATTCP